jgi:hypothetical protein
MEKPNHDMTPSVDKIPGTPLSINGFNVGAVLPSAGVGETTGTGARVGAGVSGTGGRVGRFVAKQIPIIGAIEKSPSSHVLPE